MDRNDKDRYVFYKGLQPKNTFGSKVKSAFRKVMLVAAAGTAIGGYHTYGTGTDVTVTVEAIEHTPATADTAAHTIIRTDQGTFINERAFTHLKGAGTTQEINNQLRVGAKLTLRVYGLNPTVFGYGLHNVGIYRNILSASPVGTNAPAQQPAAPSPRPSALPFMPGAPEPAGLRTVTGVAAGTDLSAPQSCVDSDKLDDMRTHNPQIYRDLSVMERLPITGKPVFDAMMRDDSDIRACLTPFDANSSTNGTFQNGTLRVMRGISATTTMHEYFHAQQFLSMRNDNGLFKLTISDYAVANALQEAASVAYSLMLEREAKNHNIEVPGNAEGVNRSSAHNVAGTRAAFDRSYDQHFAANAHMDAPARERAALEAAGREVVRTLMLGDDGEWLSGYTSGIVANANANTRTLSANSDTGADYAVLRTSVFGRMGKVSDSLNVIPQEYLNGEAKSSINRSLRVMGLQTVALPEIATRRPALPALRM